MSVKARTSTFWRNRKDFISILKKNKSTSSQYAEDMIFNSLLQPSNTGTYVDVGSHDPVHGSNTYGLYLRGRSGLTIDPNPTFASLFELKRPRDIHLTEAVALRAGILRYTNFENDLLNTLSTVHAGNLIREGSRLVEELDDRCRPLADMVGEHLHGRQIDLMSVDCEGLDLDAIKSLDLSISSPTVLIVEDYGGFKRFQGVVASSALMDHLAAENYTPIAQSAWSTLLVANDWPELFKRSQAYSLEKMSNGYMPGNKSHQRRV